MLAAAQNPNLSNMSAVYVTIQKLMVKRFQKLQVSVISMFMTHANDSMSNVTSI